VLSATQITTPTIGATLAFTVTRNGQPVTPTLTVRTERRWLSERAVLNVGSLAAARQLVATGPGEVVINVAAEGLTDSVIVRVVPPRPLITALSGPAGRTHLATGDTLVLRGFGMQTVTAAQLFPGGLGLSTATTSDSASLRLVTTSAASGGPCTGRTVAYRLTPSNVDLEIPVATPYTRARTGELALATGEAVALNSAAAGCIRVAPQAANARYLLAWVDDRRMVQAETQFEVPAPGDVTVQLQDQSGPAAAGSAAALHAPVSASGPAGDPPMFSATRATSLLGTTARASRAMMDVPFAACGTTPTVAAWAIYCRTTPWVVGATFNFQPTTAGRPATTARIIATRPKIVAAIIQADEAMLAPAALTRIEATLDFLNTQYLASLRQSLGTTRDVVTSPGSGQLVVMFEAGGASNTIRTTTDGVVPQGAFSFVSMLLNPINCFAVPASCADGGVEPIIVHEVVHTYQFLSNREVRNGLSPFGQTWSMEGGASLHELLTALERHAVPWNANTQFESFASNDPRRQTSIFTNGNVGLFTLGYRSSAAFLRYLAQRLVTERGMTFTDALREVQIGAIEGWYGIGFGGASYGQGLVPRMRTRFGPSWNPVDAMLEWTMAQAADDLTANPRFQDLTSRTGPREVNGRYVHNGIVPSGGVVSGSGSTTLKTSPSGNSGVFQMDDTAAGGSYVATASVGPAVRWMILRVR